MADYTWSFTEVVINPGMLYGTIDIKAIDDDVAEPDEIFELDFTSFNRNSGEFVAGDFHRVNFEGGGLSATSRVTIKDDDRPPAGQRIVYLHGGDHKTQITLQEGQDTTVTATLVGEAPTMDIEIPIKHADYPVGEGKGFTVPPSIKILAGEKSGTVNFTTDSNPADDRHHVLVAVEIDETKLPDRYSKGDRSRFEVILEDTTPTTVSLRALSHSSLTEDTEDTDNNKATFEIHMSRPVKDPPSGMAPFNHNVNEPPPNFVLDFSGKAKRNPDYTIREVFNPGNCMAWDDNQTCKVDLTVLDDDLYEADESAVITLKSRDSRNNIPNLNTSGRLSLTIVDNDAQPMLSIGDVTANEGGKLAFEVTRTGAMENTLSVRAATAADGGGGGANPAKADSDYTTRTGTLNFEKNSEKKTFQVTTTDDILDEPAETFLVNLSNARDTGGNPHPAIADGTATGTITDNDDAPTALEITVDTDADMADDQATIAEAAGETDVTVTATITSTTRFDTDETVMVTVGKGGDGAVEGTDYKEVAGTVQIIIPAGEASGTGTFKLTPTDDGIDEDDEALSVEGALTGMTVTHAAITIEDDDTRGITVSPVTLTLNEADDTSTSGKDEREGTYEVVLTSQPEGGEVTVNINSEESEESKDLKVASVEPSSLTFTADNWQMAQTVTVTAKDDTVDDTGDEKTTTITHTVSAKGTDYKDETVAPVAVTVLDDDEAPMALTITVDTDTSTAENQDKISEGATTPTVRITATLDGDSLFADDQTITITVGAEGDTATEGSGGDYNDVAEFDITLPAREYSNFHDLTLTLTNDTVDEPDETVTVAGKLAGVMVTDTMFTIVDNDATPTVTLVLTPASINESGTTNATTVTATMDGTSSEAVTLTVSATPVSPAIAGDLTLSDNKTLTIPAKSQASTGVVTIAAVDNDVDAANKTVTVSATATGGNGLVQAPGNQTLTIADDDTRGITVSKTTLTLDEADNTATMDEAEHQDTYTVVLDSEPSGGTVTIGVASGDTVSPESLRRRSRSPPPTGMNRKR